MVMQSTQPFSKIVITIGFTTGTEIFVLAGTVTLYCTQTGPRDEFKLTVRRETEVHFREASATWAA